MNQKIIQLLEECKHYDKDNRYMAASDLVAEMMKEGAKIDAALEKRICSAFLTLLDDTALDVQGNAVKSIAKITSRIQESNLADITEKLAELILNGKSQCRDIYATCLKQIMKIKQDGISVIRPVAKYLITGISS